MQVIPHVLKGAVLTCLEGVKAVHDDLPILFNDCDHAFISRNFYDFCSEADFSSADGALLTFHSDSPNFSYVRFDGNGAVTGTVEKKVVSNEAICGAYYFRNKEEFCRATGDYLEKCTYQEYFISGVYNEIAEKQGRIVTFPVDEHISFGTPREYELAAADKRLGVLI